MPHADDVIWMCIVETPDGDRHVLKLSGVPNEARTREHAQQLNPANKVLLLKRATLEEIQAAAEKLNADPTHLPVTDMNQYVPQESTAAPVAAAAGTSPAPPADVPADVPAEARPAAAPPQTFA